MERRERKPRGGERVRPTPRTETDADGARWQRANGCYIEIAEGFAEEEGKQVKSFRVGLHMIDGRIPLARLAMTDDQALDLARSLIAYAAAVDHLCEHHPDGDRRNCNWKPAPKSEAEVEQLVDESMGPLERGIHHARQYTNEVISVLEAMRTMALEEGLLAPDGAVVAMTEEKGATVGRRIDNLMRMVSPEARRVLAEALYQTGDETMAEFFGRAIHEPSSRTAH